MDRRKFLQQSGANLGEFLASPQLGIFAALVGGVAASDTTVAVESKPCLLLRSGEPINARGEPFGTSVSALSALPLPEVTKVTGKTRALVVLGHSAPPAAITTLEISRDSATGRWRHEVASSRNRMWVSHSSVAVDGARLLPDAPAFRHQTTETGLAPVTCIRALPWGSFLCGEEWIVEINPQTGSAIRRVSLGRVSPKAMAVVAEAGAPVFVYLQDAERRLFRFRSHQQFEARMPSASASAMVIGELEAADSKTGQWRALTAGLAPEAWLARMNNPAESVSPVDENDATFAAALKLLQNQPAFSFHLRHEGPEAFLYSGPVTQ